MNQNASGPNITALKARLDALAPSQRELFIQQLAKRGINLADLEASSKKAVDRWPLSLSQRHIWLAEKIQPGLSAYHIALTWCFDGDLNVPALEKALQHIAHRHQVLKTYITEQEGEPVQVLDPDANVLLQLESIDQAELQDIVSQFAQQAFNLGAAPLFRAKLLHINNGGNGKPRHVLALVWHHLIADGWSRGIFMNEIAESYGHFCKSNQPPSLGVLPSSYGDYLQHQRTWLNSKTCQNQLGYWKNQLQDLPKQPSVLPLSEYNAHEFSSGTVSVVLPETLRQKIHNLARVNQVTPFVVLLCAFNLLRYRYSGSSDLSVGIPVAGRNPDGLDVAQLIGFFVNTLVIRSNPKRPNAISDWLSSCKAALADAFDYQQVPLAAVMESLGRNDLFNAMFQYQNTAYGKQNAETVQGLFGELSVTQDWVQLAHTKFDMSWHAVERGNGLLLAVEYRKACFSEQRVKRAVDHYIQLLDSWVDLGQNAHLVSDLVMLADKENLNLSDWQSRDRLPEVIAPDFVSAFEQSVQSYPNHTAVAMHGSSRPETLSYAQLNQRANALAHRLLSFGVGSQNRVGVYLCRSPNLLVALLAVMKTGAAYVPLDASLPSERLNYMLDDASIGCLISTSDLKDHLLQASADITGTTSLKGSVEWLLLDEDESLTAITNNQLPSPQVTLNPQQAAYCIYTSGSTGKPKGTVISHSGLMHYLSWCLHAYPRHQNPLNESGALVHTSIGFDATITGLFAPLLTGACVTMMAESASVDSLAAELENGHAFVKLTPAHLAMLQPLMQIRLQQSPAIDVSRLPGAFVIGGEALTEAHVAFWRTHFPSIRLINEYGPTETVVGCAHYEVKATDQGNMPIGKPIAGAQLYVLGADLNPLPAAVPGELYIGGDGMALGYLKQPGLTAEKFIPDPFSNTAGAVLYRTGDLAQWREDGELLFLGRKDQQLSLRGYRIEPGEVESALVRRDDIDDAVVRIRNNQLVAYLMLSSRPKQVQQWFGELQSHLTHSLPNYMIPSALVLLDEIPLTSNGKVDRVALAQLPLEQDTQFAHLTELSQEQGLLVECWQLVLNTSSIQITDNFFDVGGDSVSAMQIVAQLHQKGFELAPAVLFEHHTIFEQAKHLKPLTQQQWPKASGTCRLTPIQRRFFEAVKQGKQHPHHFNQSIMLSLASDTNPDWLYQSLQHLVEQHDSLRLRYSLESGEWVGHYAQKPQPISVLEWNVSDWPAARLTDELGHLQTTLNIENGPLLKACLITHSNGQKQLALIAHHLIVDGVSWRLLVASLASNYQCLEQGLALPSQTTSPPFNAWADGLLDSATLFEQECEYWQSVIDSAPLLFGDSEGDSPREITEQDMHVAEFTLSQGESESVLDRAKQDKESSVEPIILLALAQTLCGAHSTRDLIIEMESHGRWHEAQGIPNVSTSVGWFTSAYPVRLRLLPQSPAEQLTHLAKQLRDVPRLGIGFGVLQQTGQLNPTINPQVFFNYLGVVDTPAQGVVLGLSEQVLPQQNHPNSISSHPLKLIAYFKQQQLHIVWRYSSHHFTTQLIQRFNQQLVNNLASLCAKGSAIASSTPSTQTEEKTSQAAKSLLSKLKKRV